MLRFGDQAFEELVAIDDAEELCRRLLASPWCWGSSARHAEAVELLAGVHGTGELPMSFVTLLLSTCRRWDRVTSRLIAAVEDSGLLDSTGLDELAESLLSHEQVIAYPLAWVSSQWLEIDLDDGQGRICTVDEETLGHHRVTACASSTVPRQPDAEHSATPTRRCGNGERPSQSSDRPCSRRDELVSTGDQQRGAGRADRRGHR